MKSHTKVWLFFCIENGWRSDFTKVSELIRESDFNRESEFDRENGFV